MTVGSRGMHPELRRQIVRVARSYRRRRLMQCFRGFGWAFFGLTCVATLLLWIFSPDGASGVVLVGAYALGLLVALWILVLRKVFRPLSLAQVARYIDEHHPELEDRISSAVEFSEEAKEGYSPWLIEQFLEETRPIVRATSLKDVLNPQVAFNLAVSAFAMLLASGLLLVLFSDIWLPSIGFLLPEQIAEKVSLPFTVEPGDVRVRRGDNQMIWIRTHDSDRAVMVRWRIGAGVWQSAEADQSGTDRVYYHQFVNVQKDVQYQVQYGPRRSPNYAITAWTPPEIDSIDLTYNYPDYTQRPSREVPNSGNIAALEGTSVDVEVWVNKKLASAEMVLESGGRLPLAKRADTLWSLPMEVRTDDAYHIELFDLEGETSEYNPSYTITSLRDKAPEIQIDFPRGDNEVTMLEEVPFDFEVTDDFGFDAYGLEYTIAGKEAVRIELNEGPELVMGAEGHYQIHLEELSLEVGDFITWTIWATDTKPDRSEYELMGDPYFLEIRPFRREYREALTGGGGGGGGGMQGGDDLYQAQKNVLIATWNLRRESRYMDEEEFDETRAIIVETQEDLIGKAAAAARGGRNADVLRLRDAMQGSVDALTRASLPEPKAELSEATTYQQQANRLLARMRPRQNQVQQTQGGGGGGGGGAENRPDISELEMARNRNFYEEQSLTREQQEATDEILNRIKELAQRQQSVNDELAKLISEWQNAQTEEEKERIRRKLERLEEEMQRNLERLDEASRDLSSETLSNKEAREAQEALERARHQMNRSLDQLEKDRLQSARSAGARAMDALGDIQEHLQQFSREAAAQRMRELQQQFEDLREKQNGILEETAESLGLQQSPDFDSQEKLEANAEELKEEKETLVQEFIDMMDEASELAERGEQTQELMARELGDWLRETSKTGILEDIEESQPFIEYGIWDKALEEETEIARKFDEAAEKLAAVAESLVEDDLEGMQKALEHLDTLLNREEVAAAQREGREGEETAGANQGEEGEEGGQEGDQPSTQGREGEEGGRSQVARAEEGQSTGRPGAQQGEESQGQESSDSPSQGQPGQAQQGQANNRGGSLGADAGFDPQRAMRDFADSGYQEWLEELRSAESLLPQGTEIRTEVTRIREQIQGLRREWRERKLAPQYDLFLEVTARPLLDAANRLQSLIERQLNEKEFILVDEGDIPERYKKKVANYFKQLSEAEGAR